MRCLKKLSMFFWREILILRLRKKSDHYVICSTILKNTMNAWYIIDNPLTDAPRFYSYKNNYRLGFVFSRYQDYITVVSNVVASL